MSSAYRPDAEGHKRIFTLCFTITAQNVLQKTVTRLIETRSLLNSYFALLICIFFLSKLRGHLKLIIKVALSCPYESENSTIHKKIAIEQY